jgi:hypothetical protein
MTTGVVNENFDSLGYTPGQYVYHNTSAGLSLGAVTYVGVDGAAAGGYQLLAMNPGAGWGSNFNSGTLLQGPDHHANSYLMITLPGGVTSFGLDLASVEPYASNFRIELDSIDLGVIISTLTHPNLQFFGVRTDVAFSTVKVILTSGSVTVTNGIFDNVSYGAALVGGGGGGGGEDPPIPGETPEITSLIYLATGLGLVGWTARRRKAGMTLA